MGADYGLARFPLAPNARIAGCQATHDSEVTEMPAATAMAIYNQDIRGLASRINRFITELVSCTSANLANVNEFDAGRLESYIKAIRTYHDWVMAQPALDLPETQPRLHTLDPDPAVPTLENEAIRDAIVMMQAARDELVNSQSARMPVGLLPFDSRRMTSIVNKVEAFLISYVREVQPLDLPESSPTRDMGPAGKTGV